MNQARAATTARRPQLHPGRRVTTLVCDFLKNDDFFEIDIGETLVDEIRFFFVQATGQLNYQSGQPMPFASDEGFWLLAGLAIFGIDSF